MSIDKLLSMPDASKSIKINKTTKDIRNNL